MARELIEEILLVSTDQLIAALRNSLEDILEGQNRSGADPSRHPIALYAEREMSKDGERVLPFFPSSERGRASGRGVAPIIDVQTPEVGSEGIIANFITSFCRLRSSATALNHPGPDKLRLRKVRAIVVVTDFIGSGNRVFEMLEAFRNVATLRSWQSYGLLKYFVVAYAGTLPGIQLIERSKLRPEVMVAAYCPTIKNTFQGQRRRTVENLCQRYPNGHPTPLGYRNSGALIAFAHMCPNNAPPILHSGRNGWVPLFPGRSTSGVSEFFEPANTPSSVQRLQKFLKLHDAREFLWATSVGSLVYSS